MIAGFPRSFMYSAHKTKQALGSIANQVLVCLLLDMKMLATAEAADSISASVEWRYRFVTAIFFWPAKSRLVTGSADFAAAVKAV